MHPPRHINRLAQESSPYLLQHAHNPVDWYPWGEEAFAAAREQNKPIFLSVGYSTCYWCHVMERQSFENEQIAAEMNKRFINVKVDREERPDVDQLYMNAVHAQTGQGGWPMSVFLTPTLKPFYSGTYFPPADMHGRPGFPRLLAAIDDAWKNRRDEVEQTSTQMLDVLRRMAEPRAPKNAIQIDLPFINELLDQSTSDFDAVHGGFGSAPKFPRETLLELILVAQRAIPNQVRLNHLQQTLDAMADGGIHDHLGGGFHRYSTDDQWLVPHFEIMLYDNAMLAWVYAEAFAQTKEKRQATVARGILDFVLREMTSPEGAFYTAIDAEVDAQEGMPYLWTADEIAEVLGKDAEVFNHVYGVDGGPNFADPHHGHGVSEKNILYLVRPITPEVDQKLAPMRQALYAKRRARKQPLLDTKILTSWNALTIRALAHAGKILEEPRYLAAAGKAAEFLLNHHRSAAGGLYRLSRDGRAKGEAFLDDYAFLADALLTLSSATGESRWRTEAEKVFDQTCSLFLDPVKGGFYFTAANAPDMLVRQKTASDSPLPAGNAIAAAVALELGHVDIARHAVQVFAGQLESFGMGMSALVQIALRLITESVPISLSDGGRVHPPYADESVEIATQWSGPDLLEIRLTVAAGFHINSSQTEPNLIPTRLTVTSDIASEIIYPRPRIHTFPFADAPISIYDGAVTIEVRFTQPPGKKPVSLHLQCQACTETACLATINKTWTVQ